MAKDYSKKTNVVLVGEGSLVGSVATPVFNAAIDFRESTNDVINSSAGFVQSVIDNAFAALQSGAEPVADAAEDVFEATPEVEDTPETDNTTDDERRMTGPLGAIGDFSQKVGSKITDTFDTATSTPAKLLMQDILLDPKFKDELVIDNSYLEDNEVEALKEIAKTKGVGKVVKDDYGKVSIGGDVRGKKKDGVLSRRLSLSERLYNSFGEGMIVKDEETGEYFFEDVHDWNYYIDYTDESNGRDEETDRIKGVAYTPEEFEKELSVTKELIKTIKSDAPLFDKVHNIAFLFGSRDYEGVDNPRDTGRKVRINLGKL